MRGFEGKFRGMRTLPALLILSLAVGCGAGSMPAAQKAQVDRFKCEVAALAPLTDPVLDTEQLVRDLYTGKASLGAVIANMHLAQAEAQALLERLRACSPSAPAPAPEPSAS